jgi:hypothetical protein
MACRVCTAGSRSNALDPGAAQWRTLGPGRAIGCVYWVATEVVEPGVVHHDGRLLRFPIGEPDGTAVAATAGPARRHGRRRPAPRAGDRHPRLDLGQADQQPVLEPAGGADAAQRWTG